MTIKHDILIWHKNKFAYICLHNILKWENYEKSNNSIYLRMRHNEVHWNFITSLSYV